MSKFQRIFVFVVATLAAAAAGGAAAWLGMRANDATEAPQTAAVAPTSRTVDPKNPPRYVTLEKVIVMLRRDGTESVSRYLAVDLVFKTSNELERETKDQLPLLRSVAVRALSTLTANRASTMGIDELAEEVRRAYRENYTAEGRDAPFSDVMIGKLIVE